MNRLISVAVVAFVLGLSVGIAGHLMRSRFLEVENSLLRQLNEEQKQMLQEINDILGKPQPSTEDGAT